MLTATYMSAKNPRTEMQQSHVRLLFGRTLLGSRLTGCLSFFSKISNFPHHPKPATHTPKFKATPAEALKATSTTRNL